MSHFSRKFLTLNIGSWTWTKGFDGFWQVKGLERRAVGSDADRFRRWYILGLDDGTLGLQFRGFVDSKRNRVTSDVTIPKIRNK